jgi:hypothetical protein
VFVGGSGDIAEMLRAYLWVIGDWRSAVIDRRYRVHRGYVAIAGAALIAFFCVPTMGESPAPGTSGIEGTVLVSPTRPGPIRKDEPLNAAPVGNTQFVVKAGDATVATFTTDGEGRFQVALPPGHYVVLRESAGRIGNWRFEADIVAGQMTRVKWTADSGMR